MILNALLRTSAGMRVAPTKKKGPSEKLFSCHLWVFSGFFFHCPKQKKKPPGVGHSLGGHIWEKIVPGHGKELSQQRAKSTMVHSIRMRV